MNFNEHYKLKGRHATLSASNYHWINYNDEKMRVYYGSLQAKVKGTALHNLAEMLIKMNQRLPKSNKTLNMYVNDAINYKMTPERILYYSDDFFGTADAISFKNNFLRIHDLKTGKTPAHFEQLIIYAALFCLEYGYKPEKIKMELRIYQNNECLIYEPTAEQVRAVMDKGVKFSQIISGMKAQEEDL
jgi:hypothetical protein